MKTNSLLLGPVATGKSYCLRTLLRSYPNESDKRESGVGLTLLHLGLEPGFEDSLAPCACDDGYHFRYIKPLDADWDDLEDMATRILNSTGDITKIVDPNKRNYTQFLQVYSVLQKFVCDRCGHDFGAVDKLDDSYAVAMDGLTGLSTMAMHLTVGLKPAKSWPEFDASGQQVENILRKCVSIDASFILIAHMDREIDPTGGSKLTMHTIGNKLAHRLTKDLFSEIVYTHRDSKGAFWWSTTENDMDLKARRLPFKDNIEPSFTMILGRRES